LRKLMTVLFCAGSAVAATPAFTQKTAATLTKESATPAQDAQRAVIAAINGGDAQRALLVKSRFSSKAFPNESAANDQRKWFDKLARDSGGLTLVSAAPQGDRMVEAIVHTKRGDRFGKLVLFTSSKEPGKISDLFLLPARDPARLKAEAWPTGTLTPALIAAEIEKRAARLAAEGNFSGVVLVAKNDRVIVRRAYGFADEEWRVANRPDTRFHLGSVGKMFTAAAILTGLGFEHVSNLKGGMLDWCDQGLGVERRPHEDG